MQTEHRRIMPNSTSTDTDTLTASNKTEWKSFTYIKSSRKRKAQALCYDGPSLLPPLLYFGWWSFIIVLIKNTIKAENHPKQATTNIPIIFQGHNMRNLFQISSVLNLSRFSFSSYTSTVVFAVPNRTGCRSALLPATLNSCCRLGLLPQVGKRLPLPHAKLPLTYY